MSLASSSFSGCEVERPFENAKGFVLVEDSNVDEVAHLQDEAASFLQERRLGLVDVLPETTTCFRDEKWARRSRSAFLGFLGNSASVFPSLVDVSTPW